MRWVSLVALLCGCQYLYGVDSATALHDASPADAPHADAPRDATSIDAELFPTPVFVDPNGDFDGDQVMNSVDPCPFDSAVGSGAPDQDHDGIGDACDPHIDEPDCLVLFDDFTEADTNFVHSGTWQFGACSQSDGNGACSHANGGAGYLISKSPWAADRVDVIATVVDTQGGSGAALAIGSRLSVAGAGVHGRLCGAFRSGDDAVAIVDFGSDGGSAVAQTDGTGTLAPNQHERLRWTPANECDIQNFGSLANTGDSTGDDVGVLVANGNYVINGIIVYSQNCRAH